MFDKASGEHANGIFEEILNLLKNIIIELRPKQWYKNVLLFIGIIFSLHIFYVNLWMKVVLGFTAFCLLSGSIYIINDVFDKEADRLHPVKCNRPIASGRLDAGIALVVALALVTVALIMSFYLGVFFLIIAGSYLAITLLYNFLLKDIYLIDVFTISAGLVLRAVAGCVAIDVTVSPWLILCTFLASMYLALGKRRHELVILKDNADKHRRVLGMYSVPVLDSLLGVCTSALIVSYSMYTFLSGHIFMMITIPFVLYGLFRYTDHIYNMKICGEPEMIFKDTYIIADIMLWGFVVLLVLLKVPEMIMAILYHL